MKKRLLALIMTLCVAVAMVAPAIAVSDSSRDNVVLQRIGHGEYAVVGDSDFLAVKQSSSHSLSNGRDIITAKKTDDSKILYLSGNNYLCETHVGTYQLTEKLAIDSNTSLATAKRTLDNYNADDVMKNIEDIVNAQRELGNDELLIEIYVPAILTANAANGQVTYPETEYYLFRDMNGKLWQMRDIYVKYWHLYTELTKVKGTNASSSAGAFVDVVISAVGLSNTSVSVFGLGKSLLSLYTAIYGPVVYSSSGDETWAKIIYDRLEKTSQFKGTSGSYLTGKKSDRVWLDRLFTYQYYSQHGRNYTREDSINRVKETEQWNDGQAVIARVGTEPPITAKLYGKYKAYLNGVI